MIRSGADDPEREDKLRLEAAAWFARMRREDATEFKPAFDAWLAEPNHLAAYNRIAERFADSKILRSALSDAIPHSHPSPRRRLLMLGAGAMVLAALAALFFFGSSLTLTEGPAPSIAPVQIATLQGEIRNMVLADGSRVTMDTDTLLTVSLGPGMRHLRLERGRARFDVAHEARPFVVAAGNGKVTARGTLFDVSVENGAMVHVALLRGAVDVALQTDRTATPAGTRHLRPGDEVAFDGGHFQPAVARSFQREASWPQGMIEFDRAPLSEIIARANRYAPTKISLAEARLGDIRASGRFRISDPDRLAETLARLFGLEIDRGTPGMIVLRRGSRTSMRFLALVPSLPA